MSRLRIPIASASVFSPTPCSTRPGTGSVRDTDPRATMRWSYSSSVRPSSAGSTWSRRASGSAPVTSPSRMSTSRSSSRSGTTTWRGSRVPAAAPAISGVNSMKFSRVTSVTRALFGGRRRLSSRAA
jgi:hypothetical protein